SSACAPSTNAPTRPSTSLKRAHLRRWCPRRHAHRTRSTARMPPSCAGSHLGPFERSAAILSWARSRCSAWACARAPRLANGEARLDAVDRLFGGGAGAEGREAEVALAARPEARARRPDGVGLVQELVEEIPRGETPWCLHPDVRSVAGAVHSEPGRLEPLADDPRVLHVVVDDRGHLLLALARIRRGRRALDHVRDAVELGR